MSSRVTATWYIVALKRERRADVGADWLETLRTTAGVEVTATGKGPAARRRVRVRATASGAEALRERLGELCHIEPLVAHRPGDTDADADADADRSDERELPADDDPSER